MILFGYTDNQGILLGNTESRYEPWGSSIQRAWFSSWYVVSIHTGHIAQSPQSIPRWSPAFKMEPVHSVSSFSISEYSQHIEYIYTSLFGRCIKWFWTTIKTCLLISLERISSKLLLFGSFICLLSGVLKAKTLNQFVEKARMGPCI